MMYLLAYVNSGREFDIAHAINEIGALAVAPRMVEVIKATPKVPAHFIYVPFAPGYLFLAVTEAQWYDIRTKRLTRTKPNGVIATLAPPSLVCHINEAEWRGTRNGAEGVLGFLQRADLACDRDAEMFEAGRRVRRYKHGDRLRIVGDLLDGRLRDKFAKFVGLDAKGNILAVVEGLEMMGKPVRATIPPGQAMAAE